MTNDGERAIFAVDVRESSLVEGLNDQMADSEKFPSTDVGGALGAAS